MADVDHKHAIASVSSPYERSRRVRDPVHDYITISSRLSSFIDTRQFQRLRFIKQLGTSYYVWPGASHNRFEHSLGVAHLARLMAEHLQKTQPELNITDRDVECVELAGLCHDLGHGPWSHIWDNTFIPRAIKERKWRHEDASEMMFDYLVKDNEINISKDDCTFIKALIICAPERCKQEKSFLFEIVSNGRNGIDVDKFDYILRDTHAVGEKGNLSLTRLIQSARVVDNQICYDIKDANQIYELFYTRFSLHKRIYNHKTAKAIEYMLVDALLAAEPHLHIAEQVFQPEKFVYLTEDIMSTIERSTEAELAESRAIIDRIRTRDLYKLVDYTVLPWEYREFCKDSITPESIVKAAENISKDTASKEHGGVEDDEDHKIAKPLRSQDIIVDLSEMHYGMKEKNPMDFVKFYSKNKPNQCANAGRGDISLLMPAAFAEFQLRVYTRNANYFGIVQEAYRAVVNATSERMPPSPDVQPTSALTPPATEGPTTPRAFSRNPSYTSITFGVSGSESPQASPGSFPINNFTTVPPSYVPSSPTSRSKRARMEKRQTDALDLESPVKKRRH